MFSYLKSQKVMATEKIMKTAQSGRLSISSVFPDLTGKNFTFSHVALNRDTSLMPKLMEGS